MAAVADGSVVSGGSGIQMDVSRNINGFKILAFLQDKETMYHDVVDNDNIIVSIFTLVTLATIII